MMTRIPSYSIGRPGRMCRRGFFLSLALAAHLAVAGAPANPALVTAKAA